MKSMRDIKKDLLKRRDELGRVKGYAENKLSRAPKGSLRTSVNKGLTRYYEVEECGDTRGKYINAKNLKRAKALAEKDYYQKLVKQAQKELNGIERMVKIIDNNASIYKGKAFYAEEIYDSLNDGRRSLVSSAFIGDEEYAEKWQAKVYPTNPYKPEEKIYPTTKGDMVRSKSEALLANMYYRLGIPYRYEAEIKLEDGKRAYPDFTLLDISNRQEIYHEHLGRLDEDKYCLRNLCKIEDYRKVGIFVGKNLLITHEITGCPLNLQEVEKSMKWIFKLVP